MIYENNLLIYKQQQLYLINLFSFRRKLLSNDEKMVLEEYISFRNETKEYLKFKQKLTDEKQILSPDLITVLDNRFRTEVKKQKNKENYRIGSLTFIVSLDCNMKCSYCYQRSIAKNYGIISNVDIGNVKKFVSQMKEQGLIIDEETEVIITGGEPLLETSLDVVKQIIQLFKDNHIRIMTNGLKLIEIWQELPIDKIDSFQISLDHLPRDDKETDFYEKIISGIKKSIDAEKKVSIVAVLEFVSVDEIKKLIIKLKEEGILRFCSIQFCNQYDFEKNDNLKKDVHEIISFAKDINKEIPGINNIIEWHPAIKLIRKMFLRDNNEDISIRASFCNEKDCIPIAISPKGEVLLCNSLLTNNVRKISNISDSIIDKEEILKLFYSDVLEDSSCKKCSYRYVCLGGCPAIKSIKGKNVCTIFSNEHFMDNIGEFI